MLLAFAGPLTNFIIVFILIILNNLGVIVDNIFLGETAIYANILIGVFNLIPIYPLDGGRIIKEIINIRSGMKKSYCYINKISNIKILISFSNSLYSANLGFLNKSSFISLYLVEY